VKDVLVLWVHSLNNLGYKSFVLQWLGYGYGYGMAMDTIVELCYNSKFVSVVISRILYVQVSNNLAAHFATYVEINSYVGVSFILLTNDRLKLVYPPTLLPSIFLCKIGNI